MSEFVYQVDKVNDNLYFIGKINIQSVNTLTQYLHQLEKEKSNSNNKSIKLYITSDGGTTYNGLKLVDMLNNSTLDITIYFSGFVGSAATFLLGTKHKTIAYENTIFAFHELSDNTSNSYSNVLANAECSTKLMNKIVGIYNTKNKIITKEWLVTDKYLTAQEALEMNLIDEII